MGLIRTLLWFGLFLASTFAFTVLFEYGPSNFVGNSQKQFDALVQYYHAKVDGAPPKKP
jgi:hypothetical protein